MATSATNSASTPRSSIAIDMHVHIEFDDHGHTRLPPALTEASAKYFKAERPHPVAGRDRRVYRERNMAAVVFTVDARTALGHRAQQRRRSPPAAARQQRRADPLRLASTRAPARRPSTGARRRPMDLRRARVQVPPAACRASTRATTSSTRSGTRSQELGLPAIFHTGQNGIGAGLPGGCGIKLGYSNPLLLDDVAADFPGLQIIMAHPSVPWQDEAISIATHKANVYIDLSGWSPKYFPESLVRLANSVLQDKVLFGTDFPLITPENWLGALRGPAAQGEVRPKILKHNAVRLLGLGG